MASVAPLGRALRRWMNKRATGGLGFGKQSPGTRFFQFAPSEFLQYTAGLLREASWSCKYATHRVLELSHVSGDHLKRARVRQRQALLLPLCSIVVEATSLQPTSRRLCVATNAGCTKKRVLESPSHSSSDIAPVACAASDGDAAETAYAKTASSRRVNNESYDLDRAQNDNQGEHRGDKSLLPGCLHGGASLSPASLTVVVPSSRRPRAAAGRHTAARRAGATAFTGGWRRGRPCRPHLGPACTAAA